MIRNVLIKGRWSYAELLKFCVGDMGFLFYLLLRCGNDHHGFIELLFYGSILQCELVLGRWYKLYTANCTPRRVTVMGTLC